MIRIAIHGMVLYEGTQLRRRMIDLLKGTSYEQELILVVYNNEAVMNTTFRPLPHLIIMSGERMELVDIMFRLKPLKLPVFVIKAEVHMLAQESVAAKSA